MRRQASGVRRQASGVWGEEERDRVDDSGRATAAGTGEGRAPTRFPTRRRGQGIAPAGNEKGRRANADPSRNPSFVVTEGGKPPDA